MKRDTEGIVLRETKTSYNRRMILLFTKDYGKISAGTSIGERGKTKSALALQHFTFGKYVLHEGRNSYNIDSAEVIRSFFGIAYDTDKYFNGSYVLEFTGKVLEENVPMPAVFNMLVEFFDVLEKREKGFGTLVLAYQVKLFGYLGVAPVLDRCAKCGKAVEKPLFSVTDGGIICEDCAGDEALIYPVNFDIIDAFRYFVSNPLRRLENIALNEETGRLMQHIVREYAAYHLDASNIKSESMVF
ncbi:MAG: DNA repair protein RecO [Clostridia bacterium]|nr:DNA repair protein RecO [Clostridia bacterium]